MSSVECFFHLIIILYAIFTVTCDENQGCRFDLNQLPQSPLVFIASKTPQILYPNKHNVIEVAPSKIIRLNCINGRFNIAKHRTFIDVKCIKDDVVETLHTIEPRYLTEQIKIAELECDQTSSPELNFIPDGCSDGNQMIQVGYRVWNQLLSIFNVCFDTRNNIALYSYYDRSYLRFGYQEKIRRIGYYSVYLNRSVEQIFHQDSVKVSLEKILGEGETQKYLKNDIRSVVPVQLTPMRSFVYGAEQLSTFVDVNVVPVWNILRDGIWSKVEEKVHDLLIRDEAEYQIATGTYDSMRFKDDRKRSKRFYLSNGVLPLPKFIWKIIYNKLQKTGVVLIMINDPFIDRIRQSDLLCDDICDRIQWLDVEGTKHMGVLYCCEMNEFLEAVGYDEIFN